MLRNIQLPKNAASIDRQGSRSIKKAQCFYRKSDPTRKKNCEAILEEMEIPAEKAAVASAERKQ
jgi:hypothetical protein